MYIQSTVYYIIAITAMISIALVFVNKKIKQFDPLSQPKGIVLLTMMGIQTVDKMTKKETNPILAKTLSPYICSVFVYIFLSNIAGLIGFECPTANFSVTLTLAAITVFLIESNSIRFNGTQNYIKSLFEPFPPFIVMNLIGKIAPLVSLSMRLFGNILAGGILMSVIYSLTAIVSGFVPIIGKINFFGLMITPFLHFYFDLFAGVMQAYLFITLTLAFIGKELPKE